MLWECLSLVSGAVHPCPSILPHPGADVKREIDTYLSVQPDPSQGQKKTARGRSLLSQQRLAEDVARVTVADVDVRDVRRVDQLLELLDVVIVR